MSRPLTKKDLWLSIFSLDAYQRGYESQVEAKGRSKTHLGNALVNVNSNIIGEQLTKAAGFFAQTYNVSGVSNFSGSDYVKGWIPLLPGDQMRRAHGEAVAREAR